MWARDAGDNRCPVWGTGRRRQSRTDGRRDSTAGVARTADLAAQYTVKS